MKLDPVTKDTIHFLSVFFGILSFLVWGISFACVFGPALHDYLDQLIAERFRCKAPCAEVQQK